MKFYFDDFVLDTEAFTLTHRGVEVGVELRVLETLVFLIRERRRVISKEELLESVWDIDFASEATLFKAIQQARKAVGDDGKSQRMIKTIHGKGYRFVAEVEEDPGGASTVVSPRSEVPGEIERVEVRRPPDGPRRKIVVSAVVVVVILTAGRSSVAWRAMWRLPPGCTNGPMVVCGLRQRFSVGMHPTLRSSPGRMRRGISSPWRANWAPNLPIDGIEGRGRT